MQLFISADSSANIDLVEIARHYEVVEINRVAESEACDKNNNEETKDANSFFSC